PVLTRAIDWDLITQQYDQMVKYTTPSLRSWLRLGTAAAEDILRRFDRHAGHPTYRGLIALGKAERTIFLCRYLVSPLLRREIEEGLKLQRGYKLHPLRQRRGDGYEPPSLRSWRGSGAGNADPASPPGLPRLHQHPDASADPC
ncbi:MAG: Tn3 family transposase, partial [Candidatus Wallbacteria bacterium]|nr:Tn3 family transposase [Candidatus Wallbacteria bacterium]